MDAEREFRPSASSGEIWYNCPASRRRWSLAPKETPTVEASQGQEIHDAMKLEDFTQLDDDGKDIAERLSEQKAKALDEWQKQFDEPTATLDIIKEERLWIRRYQGEKVCSAQVDFCAIGKRSALVLNHKTGYLRVTRAFRNIQARIEALSVRHEYRRLENVRAGFSGYRFAGYIDTVDYNTTSLHQAEQELFFNLWRTEQPDAPASPGPWCKHCPAKAICPEHASHAMLPMVHTGPAPLDKQDVIALVDTLQLPQLAFIKVRSRTIRNFCDAVDDALDKYSDEELKSVGLERVPTGSTRSVPNIQTLWAVIHKTGLMTDDEFRACLEPVFGRLENALVEKIIAKDGGTKKAALATAKEIIKPAVDFKPKSPTIKPLKGDE